MVIRINYVVFSCAYQTSDEVCFRQSSCNIIALRYGVFKPVGGRNNGVVGIEKGKAQACKTKDSDTNKLVASSDASGGRDGVVVSGGHGGVGLRIHADFIILLESAMNGRPAISSLLRLLFIQTCWIFRYYPMLSDYTYLTDRVVITSGSPPNPFIVMQTEMDCCVHHFFS